MMDNYPAKLRIKPTHAFVLWLMVFPLFIFGPRAYAYPFENSVLRSFPSDNHAIGDPVIADQTFAIDEASAAGTIVGQIAATGDVAIVNYEITEAQFLKEQYPPKSDSPDDPAYDAEQVFKVNATTGELTVANNKYLLSVLGPIALKVEITDEDGVKASATITVAINDLQVTIAKNYTLEWSRFKSHPSANEEATGGMVNGKLYVFGSFVLPNYAPSPRVDAYNTATDSWSRLQDMPPLADDAGGGGATHMGWAEDGANNIYIAAGYAADKSGNTQQFGSRRVYRYSIAEDEYTELPPFPVDRAAGALEYLDNKLYYFGGSNRARTVDQGDLYVLDLNDLGAGWTALSPMPNPRSHIGTAVFDGKIYAFAGQKSQDEKLVPQDDVHRYDPATDTWIQVTDMPKPFNHIHTSVFTYGDMIYTVGGQIEHKKGAYADVYGYSPKSNTWVRFTDLPVKRFAIVCGAYEGRIYASGGNFHNDSFTAMLPEELLGLGEIDAEANISNPISVYPNPAKDELFINLHDRKKGVQRIQVIDINGRILEERKPDLNTGKSELRIPTGTLSKGIYFLKIQDLDHHVQTARFIKE